MKHLLLLLGLIIISGCKVGPDYHPPMDDLPPKYSEDQTTQTFTIADEDLFQWWTIFNDPFLDNLLAETIAGNFDYHIALQRILQARAQYKIQVAQIFPEIYFDIQSSHSMTSTSFASIASQNALAEAVAAASPKTATTASSIGRPNRIVNFFQTGLTAVWQLDIFGMLRRSADANYELWEASAEDARDMRITMLSTVAKTYVTICALQMKVDTALQMVELDEQMLNIIVARFKAGLANEQDVNNATIAIETDKINLLMQQEALKLNIYSLSVLIGRQPESLIEDFKENHPIPNGLGKVPTGIPSDLLRRRPDIRSAERNLAASTEQIGVAVAGLFPQFSLIGSSASFAVNPLQGANIGFASDSANKLFKHNSGVWGIGCLASWPIFNFGKNVADIDVQTSLQWQSCLNYHKTVINALQEVEQALTAYFSGQSQIDALNKNASAYQRVHELIRDQFNAGLIDFTQVVQAQSQWLSAMNALTDGQQTLTTGLINVYQSLGGDW